MSTQSPARLLTAEEFAALPQPEDGSQQELVKGVVVSEPLPGFLHGACCACIGHRLGEFNLAAKFGTVTARCGVILARDPDTVRAPDLAFWSRERMPRPPRWEYPSVAPDLVAEVLSPSD